MVPFLVQLAFVLTLVTVFVMSLSWVWRDAATRGKPGFGIAAIAGLSWPLGLLLWVAFRPRRIPGYSAAAIFRFSIGSILALTAAFALIFLAIAQNCEYRTFAVVRVSPEMATGEAADYMVLKESVVRALRSKEIIDRAVLEMEGKPHEATSDYLMRNLKVTADESELITLRLNGGRSDGEDYLGRIVDVYLRDASSAGQMLTEFGNITPGIQLVMPPSTHSRPPWVQDRHD